MSKSVPLRVSRRSSYWWGVAPLGAFRAAGEPLMVDAMRLSLPLAPSESSSMPELQVLAPPMLPSVPVLRLPAEPAAARLEDAPPWLWGVLGAMLASGGGRIAPLLFASPLAALAQVNRRRRDVYERGVEQALQAHRLALAGWEAESGRLLQQYREQQDTEEKRYQGALRAWLAERERAARAALQEDRQAFQAQLQELKIQADALRASGRDASALERALASRLAEAASNPSLSASERSRWGQALQHYLATGELLSVASEPSVREESPFVVGLLAAARNPNLTAAERAAALGALGAYLQTGEFGGYGVAPSVPELIAPSRIALNEAQAVLARARVPEAQARAEYLLARAREIGQRSVLVGAGAHDPSVRELFTNVRREIQVYGELASRALTNYRMLMGAGEESAAAAMWAEYEAHARRAQEAIERLRLLQQQTGTRLVGSQDPLAQSLLGRGGASGGAGVRGSGGVSSGGASGGQRGGRVGQRGGASGGSPVAERAPAVPVVGGGRRRRAPAFAGP